MRTHMRTLLLYTALSNSPGPTPTLFKESYKFSSLFQI